MDVVYVNNLQESSAATIYVDGACKNNGRSNPKAGCGLYWGEYHPLNCSETLAGDNQTNNRAEMSAAIIAIKQAITLNINPIRICTDSRYVKEGITKWLANWKVNNWKTKTSGNVLNQNLWSTLDRLVNHTNIEWIWVEGHKSEENLKADCLAKQGISSEDTYWQIVELSTEMNGEGVCCLQEKRNPGVQKREIGDNSEAFMTTCPKIITKELTKVTACSFCKEDVTGKQESMQCGDCKEWCHFQCTRLPQYQLHIFQSTQRKYSCFACSGCDEEMMDPKKVHKESILTVGPRTQPFISQIEISKIEEPVLQPFVVRKAVTNEQTQTETSELQNTDDNLTSSVISAMNKLELSFKQHIDGSLANSVTKAINNLEHSMILTIDKLNVKSKQSETLADEITQLKEANAALTEKLYRKEEQLSILQQQKSEEKKIPNCSNCSTKSEEIKKLLASREKLSKDQHELYLQKELQSSKLLNEIETTKLKVSTKQQQIDLLQKEIKLGDERERTKN